MIFAVAMTFIDQTIVSIAAPKIQDELHLISGPLGTVAALYEAALDRLATRAVAGIRVRPKIVASTATVRRAQGQIRALFDRHETRIFPAPGIDRRDSFFARVQPEGPDDPARWYLGLAAAGRGPKLVFLQALVTLLAGAQGCADEGGDADAYRTALCYFNALRELGGARRIVEDEVAARTLRYGTERRRLEPVDRPFGDRALGEPVELTSRVSTDQVAAAKRRLETAFGAGEPVDVALATNMISVGLDIDRLGLMLVQGQPKTAAEYIQATSRVGRNPARPGLVVVVLNVHRPRDRMHFEQFGHFHDTFYRAVEATSVTPWSARALDRALAAVVVAIARHLDPALTPSDAVAALGASPRTRAAVVRHLVDRAPDDIAGSKARLAALIEGLLDDWVAVVGQLGLTGLTRELVQQTELVAHDDRSITLRVPIKSLLSSGGTLDKLKAALARHFQRPVAVTIEVGATQGTTVAAVRRDERAARQASAQALIDTDPFVQAVVRDFSGATVVPGSVKPV